MKRKGFTLIELLAVIVILAIILAIAIPSITGLIENARKSAFEDSTKMIIRSITTKQATDSNYNLMNLNTGNMEDDLGISNDNYSSVSASNSGSNVLIDIVGQGKWEGLEAHGTLASLAISDGSSGGSSTATLAPESCFTFDSGTGTITDYNLTSSSCPKNLIIPDTIGGVNVERIGPGAFITPVTQYCGFKTANGGFSEHEVDVDYVLTEGDGNDSCYFVISWDNPGPMTGIQLPAHLETIGYDAFLFNQIPEMVIPDGVTEIESRAFLQNELTNLVIPNNVITIGYGAFGENNITSLTLGNNVTTISDGAFDYNQLSDITIPNSVTYLGGFGGNQLTSITIPSSVTEIGNWSFINNRITNLNVPNSVLSIRFGAFQNNQMTNVTLGSSLETIGYDAFLQNQLTSVTIPNSTTAIGNSAFRGNDLSSVTIPSSVTDIGAGAFNDNQLPDDQAFVYARNGDGSVNNTILVSYGGSRRDSVVIPNTVITIGNTAFYSDYISSVTIPSSVTTIRDSVFTNNSLTTVTIPNSVTDMGIYAFAQNLLTSVTLPNNLDLINDYAFAWNNLSNITIPSSVTSIGYSAFRENDFSSITIPSSVTVINSDAFTNNPFTSVTIQGADPQRFNVDWTTIGFPANLMP